MKLFGDERVVLVSCFCSSVFLFLFPHILSASCFSCHYRSFLSPMTLPLLLSRVSFKLLGIELYCNSIHGQLEILFEDRRLFPMKTDYTSSPFLSLLLLFMVFRTIIIACHVCLNSCLHLVCFILLFHL